MTFFPGSLQEGIAAALQQAKSVVCFVTGTCPSVVAIFAPIADPARQTTRTRAKHGSWTISSGILCVTPPVSNIHHVLTSSTGLNTARQPGRRAPHRR